ncbi:MAG: ArsR family transcriptional regulator [Actinobacteria bacterium]|nr:MAG: ArsR family transcriptional regulator [Actinomycetota bacterium]
MFHEPHRLAIVSALLSAPAGLSFGELREGCDLTDGNLSRHLKALEDAGAVRIEKSFVDKRPRTTVFLSEEGRDRFLEYLDALEAVLKEAAARLSTGKEKAGREQARVRPKLACT